MNDRHNVSLRDEFMRLFSTSPVMTVTQGRMRLATCSRANLSISNPAVCEVCGGYVRGQPGLGSEEIREITRIVFQICVFVRKFRSQFFIMKPICQPPCCHHETRYGCEGQKNQNTSFASWYNYA